MFGKEVELKVKSAVIAAVVISWLASLLLIAGSLDVWAQSGASRAARFDHTKTGFAIDGQHLRLACESCHKNGVFKGTPRDCGACHVAGGRASATAKPATHIPTTATCDTCHRTSGWSPAVFSHNGIAPGTCTTCHNGISAPGKPANHVPSVASCDVGHSMTGGTFSSAQMNHLGIVASCSTCHEAGMSWLGVTIVTRPGAGHPISGDCSTCHMLTLAFNTGLSAAAASSAKPANHLPTTQACTTCHSATNFVPGVMNHLGIVNGCATCHGTGMSFAGVTPVTKPANHLPTTATCETCHAASNFSSFAGTQMNHSGIVSGCTSCHSTGMSFAGVTPVAKPATHIPTSAACETCHSTSNFSGFSGTQMNHTGIVSGCASCHETGMSWTGVTIVTRPGGTHPATGDCSTCHSSTVSFSSGVTSQTKPANHLPTSQPCSTCHSATNFVPGVMNHLGIVSGCATCHSTGMSFAGVTPVAKPATHIPTSAACETCHSTSNFSSFSGTQMNHTGIVSGCASCHETGMTWTGVTIVTRPGGTHPATGDCSTCHSSTVSFSSGVTSQTKPANHLPTSQPCSTCHSATNFVPGVMNHLGIVSGCATCHSTGMSFAGVTPVAKPATHIPTSAACETCHSTSNFSSFSGTQMNHTGIVSGCASCHETGMTWTGVTIVTRPGGTHPATGDCSGCHSSTVSFSSGVTSQTKPANHLPTTQPCSTCHSATNFVPGVMNHLGIVSGCATCHTTGMSFAGVTPVTKPTNHLPTSLACETCHSASKFTTFSGTLMNHSGIVSGCATCHNTGMSFAGVTIVTKPVNHVPATGACETCHSTSNFTTFSGTKMNHTGLVGTCQNCHGGQYLNWNALTKTANHVPTTMWPSCDSCHKSTTVFSGTVLHSSVIVAPGTCPQCHERSNPYGITGRPTNHTSATMKAPNSCDNSGCHTTHSFDK